MQKSIPAASHVLGVGSGRIRATWLSSDSGESDDCSLADAGRDHEPEVPRLPLRIPLLTTGFLLPSELWSVTNFLAT
eukprot:3696043-Rhodomonas_salina.2